MYGKMLHRRNQTVLPESLEKLTTLSLNGLQYSTPNLNTVAAPYLAVKAVAGFLVITCHFDRRRSE